MCGKSFSKNLSDHILLQESFFLFPVFTSIVGLRLQLVKKNMHGVEKAEGRWAISH